MCSIFQFVIYTDVGYACDQVKLPCDEVNCNNGECQNINGNLDSRCLCNEGYTGALCQHSIDDCVSNQCQNNAECVDDHNKYNCSCKDGFDGKMSYNTTAKIRNTFINKITLNQIGIGKTIQYNTNLY